MIRRTAISFLLVMPIATASLADVNQGGRTIDCFCTDKGGSRVELGEEICLFVDGRAFMARCEMSLNNPMWRETGSGCVSSGLNAPLQSYAPDAQTPG